MLTCMRACVRVCVYACVCACAICKFTVLAVRAHTLCHAILCCVWLQSHLHLLEQVFVRLNYHKTLPGILPLESCSRFPDTGRDGSAAIVTRLYSCP